MLTLSALGISTQCTPNGYFINVEQKFELEGGLAGILGNIIETAVEKEGGATQSAGSSIGVFLNQDRAFEAFVIRVQTPTMSFFGMTFGGPSIAIHFQYVKGVEVQRRRQTMLRMRTKNNDGSWGEWIGNCADTVADCGPDDGGSRDKYWKPYYVDESEYNNRDTATTQTEICDYLLLNPNQNPEALLYYNRVLTAEPYEESDKYKITPDNRYYKLPKKYDFTNDLNNNVWIAYFAFKGKLLVVFRCISNDYIVLGFSNQTHSFALLDVGNPLIFLSELSISLVLSNPVADNVDASKLVAFLRLYCRLGLLMFSSIDMAFIATNYANNDQDNPDTWAYIGQFQIDLLGLEHSVAAKTTKTYNRRRHRHLREVSEERYLRALEDDSLMKSEWDIAHTWQCIAGTVCSAIEDAVEFIGEKAAEAYQAVGRCLSVLSFFLNIACPNSCYCFVYVSATFFSEDIGDVADKALEELGSWGSKLAGPMSDFKNTAKNLFTGGGIGKVMTSLTRRFPFSTDGAAIFSADIEDLKNIGDILKVSEGSFKLCFVMDPSPLTRISQLWCLSRPLGRW